MKLRIVAVGKPGRLLADAIADYERRAARYWTLEAEEVREEKATGARTAAQVRVAESTRLLERIPVGMEAVVLTRDGEAWSSTRLAQFLDSLAVHGRPGAVFLIGGAYGTDPRVLERADRRLSLSAATLPHDLARLLLTEQVYRAGTILRGEPYHKAPL